MSAMRCLSAVLLVLAGCGAELGGDVPPDGNLAGADFAATGVEDLSASVGDGSAGDLQGACITDLVSIALTPANQVVMLNGGAAAPIPFTATGTFKDGHSAPLTPQLLAWSVSRTDDTPPGTIAGGVLQPFAGAGGKVTVTATDGCVRGSADVTLALQVTVNPPANPGDWNGNPVAGGATIVYPSNETRFPRNLYRTLFQWRSGGFTSFRLTFTGAASTVTVYTDGAHALCAGKTPAAACWEADESAWSYIAGSNAGGTVTWTVDALDKGTVPPTVRRAGPITMGFSRRDVPGAIFYWSTTSAGIRRSKLSALQPEDYIQGKPGTVYSGNNTVQCVACHTVSRDGKYLVAPVQSSASKSLWIMEVTRQAPPDPLVTSVANTGGHGFATISPDDSTVVAAWDGKLWSVERATGKFVANLPLGNLKATHPDWSPDDSQLVFATADGDAPGGASLAVIPWVNKAWGMPAIIQPASGLSNLFPMFSPDGKWIAYSRGKGGHGDNTAQLWITAPAGGAPVELINANRVVSNVLGNGQTQNSQPTWAPPGDFHWIAFNSKREYGVVQKAGTQQIWVAGIDPGKLGGAMDPSFPAFRLQFQGLAENNHRAFWALDVRDEPPPTDGGVPPPPDMAPAPDMARKCLTKGDVCDPIFDICCDTGVVCDSLNNGLSYTCIQIP